MNGAFSLQEVCERVGLVSTGRGESKIYLDHSRDRARLASYRDSRDPNPKGIRVADPDRSQGDLPGLFLTSLVPTRPSTRVSRPTAFGLYPLLGSPSPSTPCSPQGLFDTT